MITLEKIAESRYLKIPTEEVVESRLIAKGLNRSDVADKVDFNRITNGNKYQEIAKNVLKEHGQLVNGKPMFADPKKGKIYHTLINHPDTKLVESTNLLNTDKNQVRKALGQAISETNKYMVEQAAKKSPAVADVLRNSNKAAIKRQNAEEIKQNGVSVNGKKLLNPKDSSKYLRERKKGSELFRKAMTAANGISEKDTDFVIERSDKFKRLLKNIRNMI